MQDQDAGRTNDDVVRAVLSSLLRAPGQQQTGSEAMDGMSRLDRERLLLFGGFVSKVQHNYLWDQIPETLRLLQASQLELPFFAQFRAELLGDSQPTSSRAQRSLLALSSLRKFLGSNSRLPHLPILSVLEHEILIDTVQVSALQSDAVRRVQTQQVSIYRGDAIPAMAPDSHLCCLAYEPESVIDALHDGKRARRKKTYRCYQPDAADTPQVSIVELSKVTFAILQSIAGSEPMSAVVEKWALELEVSAQMLEVFFVDAFDRGTLIDARAQRA